jgi:hypothetical protein
MSSKDTQKWRMGSYGPAKNYVRLDGEDIPCLSANLNIMGNDIPTLELVLWPRNVDAELVDAIVRALPSHMYERYEHHGNEVWVDSALKGLHRAYCLCYSCSRFYPGEPERNCPKAQRLYELCVKEEMVAPVWECPAFVDCTSCPEEDHEIST